MTVTPGTHVLSGTGPLANISIAFMGEHWSNVIADGAIVPGTPIVPSTSANGKRRVKAAVATDMDDGRVAVALRTVEHPDTNTGPGSLGPNEIVNQTIADGEYVHEFRSGAFNLTLVAPAAGYAPGDLLTWDEGATRPAGKAAGTGAWTKTGATPANAFFEVLDVRYASANNEAILTVRSLRNQF
jgi:hypothetical protein